MTTHPLRTIACDEEACRELHGATLTVLEKTGVEVRHDGALELLRAAGARVDGTRARIPAALVDEAMATAPRSITMRSRPGGPAGHEGDGNAASAATPLTLQAGATYFGSGSDCLYLLGPGARDRRPVRLADVEELAALQERLPDIDFVMSMAHPGEVDPAVADATQFAAMLRGTRKPILMVPPDAAALAIMQEMATVCGAADSWGVYAMPTPPLVHGFESADRLVRCAELGIPMIYATALLPGATAPASRAGLLIVGNAEILSGLVISQLATPGAPYVYGVAQGSINLRTSHVLYCAPESFAIQQASVDLARFYGLPSFGYGGASDSPLIDEQWALEAGMTLLANAMAGVTLLHDLGYAASGTAGAFETLVVMDEMVRWVRTYLAGVTVDETTVAVDEIDAVGPGGTHLGRKYTRRHYREWLVPDLLSQQSHEAWTEAGETTLLQRAAEKTRELRGRDRDHRLDDPTVAELERLADRAREARAAG